ncbi:MAG: hypothetical protein PVG66_16135 [Chromatiales bacterium]|jgi:hypothetical protein
MKTQLLCMLVLLLVLMESAVADEEERYLRQQQLDAACEMAREQKLAPLRQQLVEQCVWQGQGDWARCEWYFHDYGAQAGRRAPLFYDLPECVEAFEYRRSYRRAD